jgi:GrpB-like predicted nucleotidyltransferase (UPF0157 family)
MQPILVRAAWLTVFARSPRSESTARDATLAVTSEALGLESGVVRLMAYDETWPQLYEAEVARIEPMLSVAGIRLEFHHTGSTSIPGMPAKPIIDILAGIRQLDVRQRAIDTLQLAGYVHRGEQGIEGRDFFRRGAPRKYHLHLTDVGSSFWRDHLAFCDFLRANPETASAYARLKLELAARYPRDRPAYIDGKTSFVENVLERARREK